MAARTVTIARLSPVAVPVDDRPDGPLVRDLAAWVVDHRLGGLERGPIPAMIPGAGLSLDATLATVDLTAWVGVDAVLLELDAKGAAVVIIGGIFPVAQGRPVPPSSPAGSVDTTGASAFLLSILGELGEIGDALLGSGAVTEEELEAWGAGGPASLDFLLRLTAFLAVYAVFLAGAAGPPARGEATYGPETFVEELAVITGPVPGDMASGIITIAFLFAADTGSTALVTTPTSSNPIIIPLVDGAGTYFLTVNGTVVGGGTGTLGPLTIVVPGATAGDVTVVMDYPSTGA